MIDIDNFKKPNDGCGHDFGNVVLVHVVAILRNVAEAEGFIVGRQVVKGSLPCSPVRRKSKLLP
jgi:predicted signal transduction protein with EAL and GGDEF domain